MKETTVWDLKRSLIFALLVALTARLVSSGPSMLPTVLQNIFHTKPSAPEPHTISASNVKILSFDSFIAHITDFITASEIAHLLALGTPLLTSSTITSSTGSTIPSPGRTSLTAFLPATDPVVHAISRRAADFQGFLSPSTTDIQITSYATDPEYKHHYDWFPPPRSTNRISTFFATLSSTCTSCGTEFPFLNASARAAYDARWCALIDCDKQVLTTLNVPGSALFWVNLDQEMNGRMNVLHAGLPAVGGEKVGLNVWTEMGVEEVRERGMFGGQVSEFWALTREVLERYELVGPGE